jgi:hypothetical protein
MVHPRGLAWRRWQERRRLSALLRVLMFRSWLDSPVPITPVGCRLYLQRKTRRGVCDPSAPDPVHCHRWEDVFRHRLRRARQLRSIHSLCACRACCGRSRYGRYLTYHERLDRIRVCEQVEEEEIKSGCVAAPKLRGRT